MSDIFKNYSNIDGIYYDKNKNHQVSFPADGYMQCFSIEDDSFWFKHRLDVINKYVSDTTISGSIIDVGGGNGFISKSLQDSNVDVILMEPGVDGVKNAQKRGVNKIICSVLEDENIDDNMIDNICLFDVVEHIENDKSFIEMVYRKLKVGGKLFITVPSLKILWSDIDIDSGHYRRYSIDEIENLLKQSGFQVVKSNYFFSFLVIPMFFLRSMPYFLKIKLPLRKNNRTNWAHKSRLSKLLTYFTNREIKCIKKNKKIRLGSSIIVVAKK